MRIVALAGLLLSGCQQGGPGDARPSATAASEAVAPILTAADAADPHSFARPLEARVTHLALDLTVDMAAHRIGGTATLSIDAKPGVAAVTLDDKGLEIASIDDGAGQPLAYRIGAVDPKLGAPVTIQMGAARKIVVHYKSAPDSGALQWLSAEQTAGKKLPFLFSQGESIENRSWIPTQDSPGIRQSWEAKITVPAGFIAVMSGQKDDRPDPSPPPPDRARFAYRMVHPVPSYDIAIAVGDLAFQALGPRTGVWAEPATLPDAAAELSDSEKMVSAAEALYGPYKWGRYEVLVLPPSFPFGGMENPNMTFLTPTFIVGDKSLVSLVAHELAHSWSGNLATNATWGDIWLNEGMTTYAERRIVESLYGKKVAAQQVALGIGAQDKAVAENGGPSGKDTQLHQDLTGRHPDDGSTDIAYEKGAAFLRMIEANVGRNRFDAYLKGWFDRHAFQPVTSSIFLADIRANLVKGDRALENRLKLDDWVYQPGVPANAIPADPAAFAEQDKAVAAFVSGGAPDVAAWTRWDTDERLRFLTHLPRKLPPARLAAIDHGFALGVSRNSDLRFAWLYLAVANRFDPARASLDDFLLSNGRGNFVKPLFKSLAKDKAWGRPIAAALYPRARPLYHPLVTRELDPLGLQK
ncbi:MAG: leukotriene A4 hydrolase C-terminal domain-containing protein [Sphingomicrobium sp.]